MKPTKFLTDSESLCMNIRQLQEALSCGRYTAEKIAAAAGARIQVGRRVMFSRKKIESYLEGLAEGGTDGQ